MQETWVRPLGWDDPLEKSMSCIVHGVTKSRTRLSDFHFHLNIHQIHTLFRSYVLQKQHLKLAVHDLKDYSLLLLTTQIQLKIKQSGIKIHGLVCPFSTISVPFSPNEIQPLPKSGLQRIQFVRQCAHETGVKSAEKEERA